MKNNLKQNSQQLLKLSEVAKYLRVSMRTVYRYILSGKLKAHKMPAWRVKKADLNTFLDKCANYETK